MEQVVEATFATAYKDVGGDVLGGHMLQQGFCIGYILLLGQSGVDNGIEQSESRDRIEVADRFVHGKPHVQCGIDSTVGCAHVGTFGDKGDIESGQGTLSPGEYQCTFFHGGMVACCIGGGNALRVAGGHEKAAVCSGGLVYPERILELELGCDTDEA